MSNGSPGVGATDYYSTNPYTQYSNSYGVSYNYGTPSPGGLLTKWRGWYGYILSVKRSPSRVSNYSTNEL